MKAIQKNKTITSLELLKKINELREKEYLEKAKAGTLTEAERKRGKFIELRHDILINIIKNEFSEEIAGLKIYLSEDLGVQNILETSQQKSLPLNEKIGKGKKSLTSIIESKYIDQWNRKQLMIVASQTSANEGKQICEKSRNWIYRLPREPKQTIRGTYKASGKGIG